MPEAPPIFLVAAERSGSTMLRLMLTQHHDLAFAGEFDFLIDGISPEGRFLKRAAFMRAIELDRVFLHHGLTIPPDVNFVGIARSFLDQIGTAKPGARLVGATLHRNFDRILWLWPDAKFVHLVRDGRDVALSAMAMGWAGNMWQAIRKWVEVETLWRRMAIKLPAARQITIKYEMLVADPERELTRITDFLGVGFDQAMLDYPRHSTYGAPFTSSIGRWKKADMSSVQAAEHRAAGSLLQNGYVLSGSVRAPSLIRRLALRIQDRNAIAAHRRAMLGDRLWLKSILLQRFGTQKARADIARIENEIIDRSLK